MPPNNPRSKSPITPLHRPGWRDGEDPIPDGIKPKPKPAPEDGAPVPTELDDAGISLDYDPVEVCSASFAKILGEELYEDDPVEIDEDDALPSVTIGAYTFTVTSTPLGRPMRAARALHALGEALRHNAAKSDHHDHGGEPCHACIADGDPVPPELDDAPRCIDPTPHHPYHCAACMATAEKAQREYFAEEE